MDSEKNIEQYLVKKAREARGKAYKFVSPGNAGVPDRIIIFPSRKCVFAELKCPGGKLSKSQKKQIKDLRKLKQTVRVVYSKSDVDELIDEFGGEA